MSKQKYYHMSNINSLESILKNGILANYKDAKSPFMFSSQKVDKHLDYELRTDVKNVVFICSDPVLTLHKMGSYIPLYELVVIEVQLEEDKVIKTPLAYDFELLHSGTIAPEFITGHMLYIEFENQGVCNVQH